MEPRQLGKQGLIVSPMVTATPGFRLLKVARMDHESRSVVSLVLESVDGRPLTVPLPGQFVVLRLRPRASGGRQFVDLLLAPPGRPDHRHLELGRDGRRLRSTWLILEE